MAWLLAGPSRPTSSVCKWLDGPCLHDGRSALLLWRGRLVVALVIIVCCSLRMFRPACTRFCSSKTVLARVDMAPDSNRPPGTGGSG
eukprot:scaffold4437_cov391-Prasinococcus_capsulatus_cf.AAC.9